MLKPENGFILISMLSIVPFIVLCLYNHPGSDDYCYANKANESGIWQAQVFWYLRHSGRYIASFILSVNPLYFNYIWLYNVAAAGLIIGLITSVGFLVITAFPTLPTKTKIVYTIGTVFLLIYQMPSTAEGLYWFAGSFTYQLSNILTAFLFAYLIKIVKTYKPKYIILAIVLLFLIMGLNETIIVIVLFLLFIFTVISISSTRKIQHPLLFLFGAAVVFACISLFAPGNQIRASNSAIDYKLLDILLSAFLFSANRILDWLPYILLVGLFFISMVQPANIQYHMHSSSIIFILMISIALIPLLGFLPVFLSLGHGPPKRVENVVHFIFMLSVLYSIFTIYASTATRFTFTIPAHPLFQKILFILILLPLIQPNNIRSGYGDLLRGRAQSYSMQLMKRYEMIRHSEGDIVFVPKLENIPKTIHFKDLTEDFEHWRNRCQSNYFQSKPIVVLHD